MDDNIIINCCEDSYVFKEGPGNNPIVQNTRKTEYEASRMGATVQPHMFYGEFISLDEAKAKGVLAPKAIHRHATPENVFFDDTRICYFNLSLRRRHHYFCSQFVAGLLEDCGAVDLPKPPALLRPADFCGMDGLRPVHQGALEGILVQAG